MIQRVQSIFLFLVVAAMAVLLSFPIWIKTSANATESAYLTAFQLVHTKNPTTFITPVYYIAILALLTACLSFFAVFKYRNRLLQMGLCAGNAILLTVTMGIVLYQTLTKGKEFFNPAEQGQYTYGFYALVAALIFNMLANRFIRRDERMVRESNRLR